MEQRRGMELDEFHVGHGALGAVHHGNAVARCHERVGGGLVHSSYATCRHNSYLGAECIHIAAVEIQHIGTVAAYIGCVACDTFPEVMLCDNLYCEMMLEHIDLRA